MYFLHRTILLASVLCLLNACGSPPAKTGNEEGANSFTYTPNSTSQNSGNPGTEGMEAGSSEAEVRQAFSELLPLMCAYDETCDDPLLTAGGRCPSYQEYADFAPDQCWVIDSAQLSICKSELSGLQCEGQYENFPASCQLAARPCECLEGYREEWIDGERGCYLPCNDGACGSGLQCYDGLCTPPQEDRCPDGQVRASVNGQEQCFDECSTDDDCTAGTVCQSGICIQEPGE